MTYFNEFGQARLGWNIGTPSGGITPSTLWNSIYSVYNADSVGSSSLKTSLYAAYNGESNANDSFGSNNGTPIGGLTYTTGKIGNAFQFNGTNSQIDFAANTMNVGDTFSVSFWVYMVNNGTGGQTVLSNFIETNGGLNKYGWFIRAASGIFYFQRFGGATASYDLTATANTINNWQHLTFTRTNGSTKLYVNGVLVAQDTNTQTTQYINTILPRIGSREVTGVWRLANGTRIDALNIWTKVLTQSEITELYNSGNGAQYITDDFYKPTTNDALGTNNGTAQGGLTYGLGKVGTAFQFNGTNAFVSMVNNSFNLTGDFSISTWLYLTNSSVNQDLFSNADIVSSVDRGYRLSFRGPTNFIRFSIYGGSIVNLDTTTSAIPLNTWTHVVATRKASTGSKIYINGVLSTSDTSVVNPNYAGTFSPCIGVYKSTTTPSALNYLTNGSRIDALNIWNKELSASEITELYNAGNGKQYPN